MDDWKIRLQDDDGTEIDGQIRVNRGWSLRSPTWDAELAELPEDKLWEVKTWGRDGENVETTYYERGPFDD